MHMNEVAEKDILEEVVLTNEIKAVEDEIAALELEKKKSKEQALLDQGGLEIIDENEMEEDLMSSVCDQLDSYDPSARGSRTVLPHIKEVNLN